MSDRQQREHILFTRLFKLLNAVYFEPTATPVLFPGQCDYGNIPFASLPDLKLPVLSPPPEYGFPA
jgi:hypothetical protein